ncbi:MAG: AAA family ATPase [Candidatus Marsarchaeota archaeon]|nr:AAA family ATPase [Candidatus Marsarchaeota archaeon]
MVVICLTGMPGSGKSSMASALRSKGFTTVEMGEIVRSIMRRRGMKIDNFTLRNFALQLRERYGAMAVAKLTAREIRRKKGDIAVVGVRGSKEIEYFKEHINDRIYVVAITAPQRVRYNRMIQRHRSDEVHSYSAFLWRERRELRYGVKGAMADADFIVSNAGTRRTLIKSASELVASINGPAQNRKKTKYLRAPNKNA